MNPNITERNIKLGATLVKALGARHFDAYYAETSAEACKIALDLIEEGSTVSWGGSMTLGEVGLINALKEGNYNLLDRDAVPPQQRQDIARRALQCDTFLMSTNAVSEDGVLVNIDGNGNCLAALLFGPKQVIVVAGMNKVARDVDSAIARARGTAAPINCQRFSDLDTLCRKTGVCGNCKSPDSICAQVVLTRLCRPAGRIKVILVGETLGF